MHCVCGVLGFYLYCNGHLDVLVSFEALTNYILDIITLPFFSFHHIVQGEVIKEALQSCCVLHLLLKTHTVNFSLTSIKEDRVSNNTQILLKIRTSANDTVKQVQSTGAEGQRAMAENKITLCRIPNSCQWLCLI